MRAIVLNRLTSNEIEQLNNTKIGIRHVAFIGINLDHHLINVSTYYISTSYTLHNKQLFIYIHFKHISHKYIKLINYIFLTRKIIYNNK